MIQERPRHPLGGGAVNPARAGMIPTAAHGEESVESKPRASGDDPGEFGATHGDAE